MVQRSQRLTLGEALLVIKTRKERYYVYVLFDDFGKEGKPFYVGKGTGSRIAAHERECDDQANVARKHCTIRSIWGRGGQVAYMLAGFTDVEAKAHELERALIAKLGRFDAKSGILANRSYGGEGSSPEWRQELWEDHNALPLVRAPSPSAQQLAAPMFYADVKYPLLAAWRGDVYTVQVFWSFSTSVSALSGFDPDARTRGGASMR